MERLGGAISRKLRQTLNPRKVEVIRSSGNVVDERVVSGVNSYLAAYMLILFASFLLISIDGESIVTNFSGIIACFNNIGPGLDLVGPASNYAIFGASSKIVLIIDMLAGRLEIFPILILLSRNTWTRKR